MRSQSGRWRPWARRDDGTAALRNAVRQHRDDGAKCVLRRQQWSRGVGARPAWLCVLSRGHLCPMQAPTFGIKDSRSILEQRQSLPIYKLKDQLVQAIIDNQVGPEPTSLHMCTCTVTAVRAALPDAVHNMLATCWSSLCLLCSASLPTCCPATVLGGGDHSWPCADPRCVLVVCACVCAASRALCAAGCCRCWW